MIILSSQGADFEQLVLVSFPFHTALQAHSFCTATHTGLD